MEQKPSLMMIMLFQERKYELLFRPYENHVLKAPCHGRDQKVNLINNVFPPHAASLY